MEDKAIHKILTEKMQRILPDARIVLTSLPQIPEIRLYLLTQDYPQGRLSAPQVEKIMSEPPYWAFCWASGQILAKWILENKVVVGGRRVLDFGSGSGVIAVAAALAGAQQVVALDIDPVACEAIRYNANLNKVRVQVTDDFDKAVAGGIGILFAADILYDKDNLPSLLGFVHVARQVYVADSRIRDLLQTPYRKIGEGKSVTCPDLDESAEFSHVSIYHAECINSFPKP